MQLRISAEPRSKGDEIRYVISKLHEENLVRAQKAWKPAELRLFLRDEEDQILGGCLSSVSMHWIEILILWVDERARGKGWAKKMMAYCEEFGKEHGAIGALVETTDFQARPFYESLGYSVFAELPDHPIGHVTYFLQKRWME